MQNQNDILKEYITLCKRMNRTITRNEYRNLGTVKTVDIEKIWGTWKNFVFTAKQYGNLTLKRHQSIKTFDKKTKSVVITYAQDGATLNYEALAILQNYCKINNTELGILWGKGIKKNKSFTDSDFTIISKYLATEFIFELDSTCHVKEYLVPGSNKNPLANIERGIKGKTTIVIGSNKQFLRMLPYKQYEKYKVAASTGTICEGFYHDTISGAIDERNHTLGAILLTYNTKENRYVPRNLVIKNKTLYDLNKVYTKNSVKVQKSIPAMVMGDLHLPEEDSFAISETITYIQSLKPENVMIHDIASWHSISHHEENKYLTKLKNSSPKTNTLEKELKEVGERLSIFLNQFTKQKTMFNIVNSNHDSFITKWLDRGEFVKDVRNSALGAELFIKYKNNGHILSDYFTKNIQLLKPNTSFNVCGFELSEHGDCGISGARGSFTAFNKGFEKIIIGHTHAPEITESTVCVGTLSQLKLCYNQQGLTKWAHCNALVHKNGTSQLIFL